MCHHLPARRAVGYLPARVSQYGRLGLRVTSGRLAHVEGPTAATGGLTGVAFAATGDVLASV